MQIIDFKKQKFQELFFRTTKIYLFLFLAEKPPPFFLDGSPIKTSPEPEDTLRTGYVAVLKFYKHYAIKTIRHPVLIASYKLIFHSRLNNILLIMPSSVLNHACLQNWVFVRYSFEQLRGTIAFIRPIYILAVPWKKGWISWLCTEV